MGKLALPASYRRILKQLWATRGHSERTPRNGLAVFASRSREGCCSRLFATLRIAPSLRPLQPKRCGCAGKEPGVCPGGHRSQYSLPPSPLSPSPPKPKIPIKKRQPTFSAIRRYHTFSSVRREFATDWPTPNRPTFLDLSKACLL